MISEQIFRNLATNEPETLCLTVSYENLKEFQKILDRALNCWPDAPVFWKELADKLTHGKVTQDYAHQESQKLTRNAGDYHTEKEITIIAEFIVKYGMKEWKEHLVKKGQGQSFGAWIQEMKAKYPDVPVK